MGHVALSQWGPGSVVAGRYRLEEELGRGGFGRVFRARDTRDGMLVAVKILHGAKRHRPDIRERFAREIAITSRLAHPAIVRLLDAGQADDATPFLVLELLRGETLESALRRGRLPVERALEIVSSMLDGLGAAHALGAVHRDVKPANVFLCGSTAKLLDFGVAAAMAPSRGPQLTATGELVGSPAYMAPEQVEGGTVGPPADVYATALVLAEMLTSERVFAESGLAAIARKATIDHAPLGTDPALAPFRALLARATARNPQDRFQSAGEMKDALRATLGGRRAPSRKSNLRRHAAVVAIVGAAAGAVCAAVLVSRGTNAPDESVESSTAVAPALAPALNANKPGARYCRKADGLDVPRLFPQWERTVTRSASGKQTTTTFLEGGRTIGSVLHFVSESTASQLTAGGGIQGKYVIFGDEVVLTIDLPPQQLEELEAGLCK